MISTAAVVDQRARTLGVLRLSLTARCNLDCSYCRPDAADPPGLMTLDQQLRLIRVAATLGAHTLRLTGGEPLLSQRLLPLLEAVSRGRSTPGDPMRGLRHIALTTNGVLLTPNRARLLRAAGLDRITISLDAVDGAVAARMAGLRGGQAAGERLVRQVIDGVMSAKLAGFVAEQGEIKLNAVIKKGENDTQLLPLAALARRYGLELRLIEYMDVGNRNGWVADQVLPAAEMVRLIQARWPLQPLGRDSGATANRWRFTDDRGGLGVIASISEPFCGDCNRLRITADGQAFTCLFASEGADLKPVLDNTAALQQRIAGLWLHRSDRYSEERHHHLPRSSHAEMAYLGG